MRSRWTPQPINVAALRCDGFRFPLATLWIVIQEREGSQQTKLLGMFERLTEQRLFTHGIPTPW